MLLMICFPTMMTSSSCASSRKHLPGLHCREKGAPQPARLGTQRWEDPEHGKPSLQHAPAGVASMVSLPPGTYLLVVDPQKAQVVPGVADKPAGATAEP